MSPTTTRVRKADRIAYRGLTGEGGGVLLHLDTGQYHGINETGRLIWERIGEGASLGDLVSCLRSSLSGIPDHVDGDVEEFLKAMAARALLILDD